jgi:hypothetical protein
MPLDAPVSTTTCDSLYEEGEEEEDEKDWNDMAGPASATDELHRLSRPRRTWTVGTGSLAMWAIDDSGST